MAENKETPAPAKAKRQARVALPFGVEGRGVARFPEQLSPDEMGDSCPLCCPACFAPLRASRASAADPSAGVKLSHRRGAGTCPGVERRHLPAACEAAARSCEGMYLWTPGRRSGDWEPHGSAASTGEPDESTEALYRVSQVLTGADARRALGGSKAAQALLVLERAEGGGRARRLAVRFDLEGLATDEEVRGLCEAAPGVSVMEVDIPDPDKLDPSFALMQLRADILGRGGRPARRWLYDAEAAKPEPKPVEPVVEEETAAVAPLEPAEETRVKGRKLGGIFSAIKKRRGK